MSHLEVVGRRDRPTLGLKWMIGSETFTSR